MDTTTERLLVPYDEARVRLGDIGRTKLHELVGDGHLVRVKIGRRGFILSSSIAEYVDSLSQLATTEAPAFDEPVTATKTGPASAPTAIRGP